MIKVENLTKRFGSSVAVDSLSFEVGRGEIVGFLGPNGAGKTTTMRLLSGYLSPDSGSALVEDEDVSADSMHAQQNIGYMPESNPLYKTMLVEEFLDICARLKRIPKEKKKEAIKKVVKAVDIADVYYRPIQELSKGYKQRVGLASALLGEPKVLLLDEPTEGLDPNQRTDIRALIKSLAKERTIIMSTHVMQEAQAVCSRIIIINKGKVVGDGTPEELSHSVLKSRYVTVDIEGESVVKTLKGMESVKEVQIKNEKGKRVEAVVMFDKKTHLQPHLTKIAGSKSWTIWKLVEEERNLEDVFHNLTKET